MRHAPLHRAVLEDAVVVLERLAAGQALLDAHAQAAFPRRRPSSPAPPRWRSARASDRAWPRSRRRRPCVRATRGNRRKPVPLQSARRPRGGPCRRRRRPRSERPCSSGSAKEPSTLIPDANMSQHHAFTGRCFLGVAQRSRSDQVRCGHGRCGGVQCPASRNAHVLHRWFLSPGLAREVDGWGAPRAPRRARRLVRNRAPWGQNSRSPTPKQCPASTVDRLGSPPKQPSVGPRRGGSTHISHNFRPRGVLRLTAHCGPAPRHGVCRVGRLRRSTAPAILASRYAAVAETRIAPSPAPHIPIFAPRNSP